LTQNDLDGKVVERGRRKNTKGREEEAEHTHSWKGKRLKGEGENEEIPLEGEEPEEMTRTLPSPFIVSAGPRSSH
jgi:hypothetical protein